MAFHVTRKSSTHLPFVISKAFVCINLVASAAFVAVFKEQIADGLAKYQTPWIIEILSLSAAVICYLLQELLYRIEELHARTRLDVKYFPAGTKDATAKMYRAAGDLFELAGTNGECDIFAVNCFGEVFTQICHDDEDAHAAYFLALENALKHAKYHRILQYDDDRVNGDLTRYLTPAYKEHFLQIIERGDGGPKYTAKLEKVTPRYPADFVIIENKKGASHLIWQLSEYVEVSSGRRRPLRQCGALLITDPDQQLIQHFKSWFTHLERSDARKVTKSELGR
jgi:hypothetical protein